MEISIPGLLSLISGVASILCWGHWYAAIPIALTIVLSMLGIIDDLKYRWPAVLGAICAAIGILLMCLNIRSFEVENTPEVVQSDTIDEPVAVKTTVTAQGNDTGKNISDWVKFIINTNGVANISFPKDYIVMSDAGVYNNNPEYSESDIKILKEEWGSNPALLTALTKDANNGINLRYVGSGGDSDAMDLSDDEIKAVINRFYYFDGKDHGLELKDYAVEKHGDLGFIVVDGNFINDNGEKRIIKDYLFNKNKRVYSLEVTSNNDNFISNNAETIGKIIESIEFIDQPAAADKSFDGNNVDLDNKPIVQNNTEEYQIGETWTVPGQWTLTITDVQDTGYRNPYSEKNPAAVYNVKFRYENLGYEDDSGFMNGLFFDISGGSIIDSNGQMGYSYPGEQTDYAQETPIGAYCEAEDCIGVDHAGDFKIILNKYDGVGNKQTATFNVAVR